MLPKALQERLASEFRFAADGMKAAEDYPTKVYFFSVFYGEPGRILNLHWERSLALLHDVVQKACQQMNLKPTLPEGTTPLLKGIPIGWMEAFDQVGDEIASTYEADEVDESRLYAALGRVAELAYVLTGNGFYLFMRGAIKL